MAKISVRGVGVTFPTRSDGNFTALDDVTFDVAAGEFLVVVGPSPTAPAGCAVPGGAGTVPVFTEAFSAGGVS